MRLVLTSTIVTNRHSIFERRIHSFIFIVRYLFNSKVENRGPVYHSKSSTSNVYLHTHFFVVDQRVFVLNPIVVVLLFCFYCVFACIHSFYLIANPYGSHNIVFECWSINFSSSIYFTTSEFPKCFCCCIFKTTAHFFV